MLLVFRSINHPSDMAFRLGQSKSQSEEKPDKTLLDFDPNFISPVKDKVVGRK
jgi:hypothetical protein